MVNYKYFLLQIKKKPYHTENYIFLFHILYTQKKYKLLFHILQEALIIKGNLLIIKELLLFLLCFQGSRCKVTSYFISSTILPLIKINKASPFILYCLSVYFFKRKIYDSSLFYHQIMKQNPQYHFYIHIRIFILMKFSNRVEMYKYFKSYTPAKKKNTLWINYFKFHFKYQIPTFYFKSLSLKEILNFYSLSKKRGGVKFKERSKHSMLVIVIILIIYFIFITLK